MLVRIWLYTHTVPKLWSCDVKSLQLLLAKSGSVLVFKLGVYCIAATYSSQDVHPMKNILCGCKRDSSFSAIYGSLCFVVRCGMIAKCRQRSATSSECCTNSFHLMYALCSSFLNFFLNAPAFLQVCIHFEHVFNGVDLA